MPAVEWVGQSAKDNDDSQFDPSRLVNCYRESHGGRPVIKSVLGMNTVANLDGVLVRAMSEVGGTLYASIEGKLKSISRNAQVSTLGNIDSDPETTISGNNGKIIVTAGGNCFVYDAGEMSQPDTGAITNIASASFIGQSTVLVEKNGRRVQWSDVADPKTYDALNFATTEQRDDNNIRGLPIGGLFWIFKERSIERWYLNGGASFFSPIAGGVLDTGLRGFNLLAEYPGGAFFVGDDGIVYLIVGGQIAPISTRAVEGSVSESQPRTAFFYEDEGHKFCVITFEDRPAWVYDISTKEWHERAEGADLGPWTALHAAQAYGRNYVANSLGYLHLLQRSNEDSSGPLVRLGVSRTLEADGQRFVISRLQVKPRVGRSALGRSEASVLDVGGGFVLGVGGEALQVKGFSADPRDAKIFVRLSKDRGETWGRRFDRSLGDQGDYRKAVIMRSLGQFETFNAEFSISEPAEIPIDAIAFVEMT